MQTVLLFKGKLEHPMNGFVATMDKGTWYLLHGMQKNACDIIKEFDEFILGDVEGIFLTILYPTSTYHSNQQSTGLVMNHTSHLAELNVKNTGQIVIQCSGRNTLSCNKITWKIVTMSK